jgi:hypothetical protein
MSASPGTHRPDTQTRTLSRSRGQSNVPASEAPERRAGLAPAYREWRSRVLLLDDRRRWSTSSTGGNRRARTPDPDGSALTSNEARRYRRFSFHLVVELVLEVRVELTRPRGSDRLSTCCVCQFRHSSIDDEGSARGESRADGAAKRRQGPVSHRERRPKVVLEVRVELTCPLWSDSF